MSDCDLRSERLVIRPIAPAEARSLHELWTSPGVRRFLWDDEIILWTRTEAMVAQSVGSFAERRFGLWGAWLTERPDVLAGFGGIWPMRDPPELELVYGVAEPLWNRGYATEIGGTITDYCFMQLAMPVVRASTDWDNSASSRVLEKLRFDFVRRGVSAGLDTVFYERQASR